MPDNTIVPIKKTSQSEDTGQFSSYHNWKEQNVTSEVGFYKVESLSSVIWEVFLWTYSCLEEHLVNEEKREREKLSEKVL